MALLLLLVSLKKDDYCLALLSLGIGGELFLVGYQIKADVYCPYCLAFGVVLFLMFGLNFEKKKLLLMAISALLGLLFFLSTFSGSITPVYAQENIITSFGSGPVKVRLYTDYFCAPCRAAEHDIESRLTRLLKKNAIRLIIVDTPVHKETPLYARYFIYMMNDSQRLFSQALTARAALFEAAEQNIQKEADLESFLAKKGLRFKPFDIHPLLNTLEGYIREDGINATPSCAVYNFKGKEVFVGGQNIIKALNSISDPKKYQQ